MSDLADFECDVCGHWNCYNCYCKDEPDELDDVTVTFKEDSKNECEVCGYDCWNELPCGCCVICECEDYVKEWLDNEKGTQA